MTKGSSSPDVGTPEWLRETGGRLTLRQAVALSVQGSTQLVRERLSRARPEAIEAAGQVARVELARAQLRGVLASQRSRVVERQGEPLLHHGCRTYLLGAALLSDEAFGRVQHEAAVTAALAHDDGLVHPRTPGGCFTADSATEAAILMEALGVAGDLVAASRAAVISHFQPALPPGAGAEAQLVALGASADVMGFGLRRVDPGVMVEIWREWPDLTFLKEVKGLLKGERRRAPRTRPGVLAMSGMPYLLRAGR